MNNKPDYTPPSVLKKEDSVYQLTFGERELFLVGTAHVSKESALLVEKIIREIVPDTVALELDDFRIEVVRYGRDFDYIDVASIIKTRKTILMAMQLIMAGFQEKIAEKTGVRPGEEFRKAAEIADEISAKLVMADRHIQITLKRAMRKMSYQEKSSLFISLFFAKTDDIDSDAIEDLKKEGNIEQILEEVAKKFPTVKKVIIEERDSYLAGKIYKNLGVKTVAVVGAGHLSGIIKAYEKEITDKELDDIEFVPPESRIKKYLPHLGTIFSILVFTFASLLFSLREAAIIWSISTSISIFTALLFGKANVLTLLISSFAAPFTAFSPVVMPALLAGYIQLFVAKPEKIDLKNCVSDAMSFSGWRKNRLNRVLFVSMLAVAGAIAGIYFLFPILIIIF